MAPRSNTASASFQHEIPPEGCQYYADLGSVPWDIQRLESINGTMEKLLTWTDIIIKDTVFSPGMMKAYG